MELFFITAPIFVLIALGYGLRVLHGITHAGIHALNGFVYWVSLPAVILMSFWGIDWTDEALRSTLITNCLVLMAFAVFLFFLLKLLPMANKTRAGVFVAALVGNTVYLGFPIGQRALGDGSYDLFLAAATPHLVFGIALSIVAIELFVLRSHHPMRYLKDFCLNPLIVALVLGIFLSLRDPSGIWIELIKQPLGMLAATASPLALVTLGAFLKGAFQWQTAGLALLAVALKIVGLPFAIFVAAVMGTMSDTVFAASVLAAAMPTAVTSFVIAEKYDANPRLVASTLFVATVLSLFSITGLLFII